MIFSLLLLVGVAVAVPVPEVEDLFGDLSLGAGGDVDFVEQLRLYFAGTDTPLDKRQVEDAVTVDHIQLVDPEKLLQLINGVGKREVEDLISTVIVTAGGLIPGKRQVAVGGGISTAWVSLVSLLEGHRQTEDDALEDIPQAFIDAGVFSPFGTREVEDLAGTGNVVLGPVQAIIDLINAGPGKRQVEDAVTVDHIQLVDPEKLLQLINGVGKREVEDLAGLLGGFPGILQDLINAGKRQA